MLWVRTVNWERRTGIRNGAAGTRKPFAPLYVHWLCAQMDLALGETARAMNELQVYSDYLQEFAVWMRKRYAPGGLVRSGGTEG